MFTKEQLIGKQGDYKTQSLFLEVNIARTDDIIMTLKEYDVEYKGTVLPSLRKIYMEDKDPTGYTTAMRVFGSWDQWLRITNNKLIAKYVNKYEEELDVKIRSGAVRSLIEASSEGAKGTTAAKYIAEKGWDKRKAGAPSKEEKKRELKVQGRITDEVQDDLERLGIHFGTH